MKEYEVQIHGVTHTLLLDEEDVQRHEGAVAVGGVGGDVLPSIHRGTTVTEPVAEPVAEPAVEAQTTTGRRSRGKQG